MYRISFDEALARYESYPVEIIRAFDILASITDLNFWWTSVFERRRKLVEALAAQIVDAALGTEQSQLQARFEQGDLQRVFSEMGRLFVAGR